MKIAFFNYLALEYGGGTARFFIDVSHGLKKRYPDLDITIISFNENISKKIIHLYSLYFTKTLDDNLKEDTAIIKNQLGKVNYYKASSLRDISEKLKESDLLYSKNDIFEAFILKYLIGYKKLPKTIFGFHTPVYYPFRTSIYSVFHNILYNSLIYKHLIKDVKILHVLNSYGKNLLKNKFKNKKVYKIYNPFEFDEFRKESRLNTFKFKFDNKKINILWVGRLTEQKGVKDLIILINEINNMKYKDLIVWNIIGDGELKNNIVELKNKWKNINYFGYVEHKYTASIFSKNDLMISTSKWESFPYNLIEAQAFGLPAIAYKIHGCDEIIEDGVNGYLVSTINSFKKKIIDYIENSIFKKQEIRIYIEKKFNSGLLYYSLYKMFTDN